MRRTFVPALAFAVLALTTPLFAGPAVGLVIQVPTANTGVPFNFMVRAVDASASTATTYTGTIHFTSSDGAAVLPADYAFTPGDAGVATFSATLHGDYTTVTLNATDTGNGNIFGSAGVTVKDPDHVVWFATDIVRNPPRNTATPFHVVAQNRDYQQVASYRGVVHFTADDASVDLPPDYTFTAADAGAHTFSLTFHRGYHHQVWVTDINSGADGSSEVWVVCPDMTLIAVNNGPICPGSNVTLSAFTNATSPTWNWHAAHGGSAYPQYYTQTAVAPYAPIWEVYMSDNDTGCFMSAQTNVDYEPLSDVSHPSSTSGDFTASIAGDPRGPYTNIQWSVSYGGTIVSGGNTATVTIRPNGGVGYVNYGVTATRMSSNCTQTVSDLYTNVNPGPLNVTVTTPPTVCPGATNVPASVPDNGAGAQYYWQVNPGQLTSGQGTRSITYTAGTSGHQYVFITVMRNGDSMSNSAEPVLARPTAVVTGGGEMCPDQTATATAMFSGTPPFNVTWTDGLVQNGINTMSVNRTIPASGSLAIMQFSDASCDGTASGEAHVVMLQQPAITTQPADTSVMSGSPATLAVSAAGDHLTFDWFEGNTGDMSKPVPGGSNTLTTGPLFGETSYWVRVQSPCGAVQSRAAHVTVAPARRRPARR